MLGRSVPTIIPTWPPHPLKDMPDFIILCLLEGGRVQLEGNLVISHVKLPCGSSLAGLKSKQSFLSSFFFSIITLSHLLISRLEFLSFFIYNNFSVVDTTLYKSWSDDSYKSQAPKVTWRVISVINLALRFILTYVCVYVQLYSHFFLWFCQSWGKSNV